MTDHRPGLELDSGLATGLGLVVAGIGWIVAVETVFPLLFERGSGSLARLSVVSSLNGYGVGVVYVVTGVAIVLLARRTHGSPVTFRGAIAIVGVVLGLFVGATLVRQYVRWHTVTGYVPLLGLGAISPLQVFVGTFARPAELAAYCVLWSFAFGSARTHPQRLAAVAGYGFVPGLLVLNFVLEGELSHVFATAAWTVPLVSIVYGLPLALAGYALGHPREDRDGRSPVSRTLDRG